MKVNLLLSFLLVCSLSIRAQQALSLQEAVSIALENNYQIRIQKNNVQISGNNVSRANAGMLPRAGVSINNSNSVLNTRQTQADGSVRELDGAKNSSTSYGPVLNWTLFDGFGMFATYSRLKELRQLEESLLRQRIIATVSDVVNTYYTIIRLQKSAAAADTAVAISRLRLNTAQNRYIIGKAARLEVLNAQVDLNTDTTSLLRQLDEVYNAKVALNQLLARPATSPFTVADSIRIDATLPLSELQEQATRQNPALQAAAINRQIARLQLREIKAQRYPEFSVNTGYTFTRSTSQLGYARQSRGHGFNYGFSASINIFNGFLQNKNERNAGLQIDNAQLEYSRLHQDIQARLQSAWQSYQTNLQLIELEARNEEVARQNMKITLAKYKLGSLTPVEFREAQRNLVEAKVRLSNVRYDAKLSETLLKELAGRFSI